MTTLANRATPHQIRLFRIVQGSIVNTMDAHPEWPIDERFVRSISKRAVGTLAAALAAMPSERGGGTILEPGAPVGAQAVRHQRRGASILPGRSPLRSLWKRISLMVGEARRSGNTERVEVLIDVLRLINELKSV